MLQFIPWFVFSIFFVNTEGTKPRSVNLALETVLAFEHKDNSANVKFIDDIQNFLSKVRSAVNKKRPVRRNYNAARSIKFTDFLSQLIVILKTYDNDDLEDITTVIDDEIRKYHYKGCKFYELVGNHDVRRFVANKLDLIKEQPARTIRKKLKKIMQVIEDAKFDAKQTEILDYINSLYTKDDGRELERILTNLIIYKNKSKRSNLDLAELVRNSIRTVVFDHYSRLSPNTRRDFKLKLETFWKNTKPKVKSNHVWNFKYNSNVKLETTKFNKNDEVLWVTPAKQNENKKYISTNKKESSHESSDTAGSDLMGLGFPSMSNRDSSQDGNKLASDELLKSDKKSSEEKERNESSIEPSSASDKDSNDKNSNSEDYNKFVTRQIQSYRDASNNEDVVKNKKRKPHNNEIKMTTPLLTNFDSTEKIQRVKDSSIEFDRKSKKQRKHQNIKIPLFITLYPETIKYYSSKKKGFKIESTTVNSENSMQTLWEEKIKRKPRKSKRTHESKLISDNLDAAVHMKATKRPKTKDYRSIIRAQKNNSSVVKSFKLEKKHRHREKDRGKAEENNRNIQMNNENVKEKTVLKSVHDTLDEENELRFILTAQKNIGEQSEAQKTQQNNKKDDKSTDLEYEHLDTSPEHQNMKETAKKRQTNIVPRRQEDLEISPKQKMDTAPHEHGIGDEYIEETIYSTPKNAEVIEKSTEEEINTTTKRQITIESITQELSTPNKNYNNNFRLDPESTEEEMSPTNRLFKAEAKELRRSGSEESTESTEVLPNSNPIYKILDKSSENPVSDQHSKKRIDKPEETLQTSQSREDDKEVEESIEAIPTLKPNYKDVKNVAQKLSISKVKNQLDKKPKEKKPISQLRFKMVDRIRTITKRYETTSEPSKNFMKDKKFLKTMTSQNNSKAFPSDESMSIESHEPKLFFRRSNDKDDFSQKDNSVLNRIDYTEKETEAEKSKDTMKPESENHADFHVDPTFGLSKETEMKASVITTENIPITTSSYTIAKENVISKHTIQFSKNSYENKSEINNNSNTTHNNIGTKIKIIDLHETTASSRIDNVTLATHNDSRSIVKTHEASVKKNKSKQNDSIDENIPNIVTDNRKQSNIDLIPLANDEANAIETAIEDNEIENVYTTKTASKLLENKSTPTVSSIKTTLGIDLGDYLASKSQIGTFSEARRKAISSNLDKHIDKVFDNNVMPFSKILEGGKNSPKDVFTDPFEALDDLDLGL